MGIDEEIEMEKKKDYLVVKSNTLVQQSRYELSLPEQKTIAFICSMIQPIESLDRINNVPYQLEYEFSIREYCRICGIDYDNGNNYTNVKRILKGLRDKSMWLELPNGAETTVGWLSKATTNKGSGIAHIKLDEDLVPYLFDLKEKFTQYQLRYVLTMKSAYSVRLYELMKSYEWQKGQSIELDELKKLFGVENVKSYSDFSLFRARVLDKAISEINELTDLSVTYETVTKGRKVVKIKFKIMNVYSDLIEQVPGQDSILNHPEWLPE